VTISVYPGSFDPITNGHLDVLARAAAVFDRIVVGVLANPRKQPLLASTVRAELIAAAIAEVGLPLERIAIEPFDGLTVDFCHARSAQFIVRGLRAISDFETEILLAHNNRRLAPDVDSVFFMTSVEHGYVSSSLVKEIARFGGDISSMVPRAVAAHLPGALGAPAVR
jgi:pantetheine-phosphate adenylyltransferase